MRNALATALAAGAALATSALATDGFRVYTSEAARRLAIERAPRPLPPATLEDQHGRVVESASLIGRRHVVGFVYTRCPSVCRRVGSELAQLVTELPPDADAGVLSVSFDPQRDDPHALAAWAAQHGADGERWRVVRPRQPAQLAAWLETFGIVVIPDGFGGFEHNAALHLLDERGRLVRILDLGATDAALSFLRGAS